MWPLFAYTVHLKACAKSAPYSWALTPILQIFPCKTALVLAATRGCIREAKNNLAMVKPSSWLQSVISIAYFNSAKIVLLLKLQEENTIKGYVNSHRHMHMGTHLFSCSSGSEEKEQGVR